MGLDMYLEAEFHVKNWSWQEEKFKVTVEGGPQDNFWKAQVHGDKVKSVTEEVGYWRKANAVHNWFVTNCADGKDECQDIHVDDHKITQLLRICKLIAGKSQVAKSMITTGYRIGPGMPEWEPILEDGDVIINPQRYAHRYLPTASGFFFGSTDYDQWYLYNVNETIKILEAAKDAIARGGNIIYRASW